jgi:acyl-CoA synthetase (AMP-forming)/AMP-acid ligase II
MRHSFPVRSFKDILRTRAAERPDDQVFGQWGEGKVDSWLSFSQLDTRARAIASRLQSEPTTGARVLLLYPPGMEYIAAFYGCLYAGVIAVPAYPPDPARLDRTLPRLRAIVADSQATIVLTTRALHAMFASVSEHAPDLAHLRWMTSDDAHDADAWRDFEGREEDIAFLQYTSGSTGSPKGVKLTNRNLLANNQVIQEAHVYSPATRMVTWLPPYHDMGLIGSILQPVYTGFPCVHMSPTQFLFKPLRWLEAITVTRATSSGAPNFAFDLCSSKVRAEQKAHLDLSSWDLAYCGAEPVRSDTLARFAHAFAGCGFQERALYPCYGLAEGTLIVTGITKGEPLQIEDAPGAGGPPVVSMGHLVTGGRMAIVDARTRSRLPDGQIGEIWVASDSVASGYWNRPEETADVFGAHLDDGAGPFLRTGDLGFVMGGELFVTGRKKELILVRGRKHFPSDIEATIEAAQWSSAHHRAGGCAAFSIQVEGEERLFVAVEIERRQSERRRGEGALPERRRGADRRARPFAYGRGAAAAAAATSAREDMDHEMIVRLVRTAVTAEHGIEPYGVFLLRPGSIPKTSSGKKQRVLCRDRLLKNAAHRDVLHAWSAATPAPAAPIATMFERSSGQVA